MTITEIFAMLNSKFDGKKTYTVAIITSLTAATAYFSGQMTMFETLQIVIPAILGATIRHGVKTEAVKTSTVAIVSAEIASGNEITGNL